MMTHRSKHKTILAGIFAAGLIIGITILVYTTPQKVSAPNPSITTPEDGPITILGMIVCLPHMNTEGPQTLECAYGLKDEKGVYYGLNDTDPGYKNISTAPMDVLVEVKGIFIQKTSSIYQSIGVINVTSIRVANTPKRISLSGEYVCLPHTDTTGDQTDECATGLKTNDGNYYALDFTLISQTTPEVELTTNTTSGLPNIVVGDHISANGVFIGIEQLNTNDWDKYPIKGTFSVTDSLKKL